MEIMYILLVIAGIIGLVLFYFIFSYIALWIQALVSGAKVWAVQHYFHAVQKGAAQAYRGVQDHGGERPGSTLPRTAWNPISWPAEMSPG